MQSKIK
ncbi:hypothetical protein VCHC38A1_0980, partial [Vibrio cholerae HC-38A1]